MTRMLVNIAIASCNHWPSPAIPFTCKLTTGLCKNWIFFIRYFVISCSGLIICSQRDPVAHWNENILVQQAATVAFNSWWLWSEPWAAGTWLSPALWGWDSLARAPGDQEAQTVTRVWPHSYGSAYTDLTGRVSSSNDLQTKKQAWDEHSGPSTSI